MQSVDPGILSVSSCFSFTPSEIARKFYFYPTWCGHYYCTSEYFMKRDYYPYLLLAYVRKGEFNVEYRGHRYVARKGNVILIDCQEPHYYYASDGLEFMYIHFDGSNSHELCSYIMSQFGILFQGENTVAIGEQLFQMIERYQRNDVLSVSESSLAIYRLLAALCRMPENKTEETSPVDAAINYIQKNVGKKITLSELAKVANLSPFYFSHIFKAHTGYSPLEYVISTRLDAAKILLKTTTLAVSEIAFRVGYENSGSFINLFVKKDGCSPTEFRKS